MSNSPHLQNIAWIDAVRLISIVESQCESLRLYADYLSERAHIEEKYSRALSSLEKQTLCRLDLHVYGDSLKKTVGACHEEIDATATAHNHLSGALQQAVVPALVNAHRDHCAKLKSVLGELHRIEKQYANVRGYTEKCRDKYFKSCRALESYVEKRSVANSGPFGLSSSQKTPQSASKAKLERVSSDEKFGKLAAEAEHSERMYRDAVAQFELFKRTVYRSRQELLSSLSSILKSATNALHVAAVHATSSFCALPKALFESTQNAMDVARESRVEEDLRSCIMSSRSRSSTSVSSLRDQLASASLNAVAGTGAVVSNPSRSSSPVALAFPPPIGEDAFPIPAGDDLSISENAFSNAHMPVSLTQMLEQAFVDRDDVSLIRFIPFDGLRPWIQVEEPRLATPTKSATSVDELDNMDSFDDDVDLDPVYDASTSPETARYEELEAPHVSALLAGNLPQDDFHVQFLYDCMSSQDGRLALCRLLNMARVDRGRRQLQSASFSSLVWLFMKALDESSVIVDARCARLLVNMSQTFSKGESEKYLSEEIKLHPLFQDLRFWEAAFFDAVQCEKEKSRTRVMRKNKTPWKQLGDAEKAEQVWHEENMVFGQLSSYALNMPVFAVSKEQTRRFLEKMCNIHELNENYRFILLSTFDSAVDGDGLHVPADAHPLS
jgi:hypothetical protein